MVTGTKKQRLTRALAAISMIFAFSLPAALGYLEQIPVTTFTKMREVERYQMRIAEKLYLRGEYKAAMSEYEKYLTLYERSLGAPNAQLMWSHCLVKQRKVYTAIREGFQSVIDYWPESHEAALAAYLMGKSYKDVGELKNAEKAYARTITEYEDHHVSVLSKWDLSEIYGEQKKSTQRMEVWKDLAFKVKRTKENSSILVNASNSLASFYFYSGDFSEGLKALESSYSEKVLAKRVHNSVYGAISTLTGDPQKKSLGEKLANESIGFMQKNMPASANTDSDKKQFRTYYGYIASLHGYARRDNEGLQAYEQLAKIIGLDDDIRGSMASWHRTRKRYAETRKLYAQFTNKINGLSNIAHIHRHYEGKPDQAVQIYNQIIGLDEKENQGKWHIEIANTWYKAGKYNEAIAAYQTLIKIAPTQFGNWYRQIGHCYEASRRVPQAIQAFRQSDSFPNVYFDIARCHRKLKQWKEALVVYHQARSDKASAPEATIQIAETYEDSGNKELAIKWFQQTCKLYPKNKQASDAHAHLQRKYKISVTLGGATDDK